MHSCGSLQWNLMKKVESKVWKFIINTENIHTVMLVHYIIHY